MKQAFKAEACLGAACPWHLLPLPFSISSFLIHLSRQPNKLAISNKLAMNYQHTSRQPNLPFLIPHSFVFSAAFAVKNFAFKK
jgi:hypothetical protein